MIPITNFGGEINLDIDCVASNSWLVRPSSEIITNDLSIKTYDGGFFNICGNNDWAFLSLQLLEPIKKEALNIINYVKEFLNKGIKIDTVILGRNDKRIMDVYFGGKDKCNEIYGIPVTVCNELNYCGIFASYKQQI